MSKSIEIKETKPTVHWKWVAMLATVVIAWAAHDTKPSVVIEPEDTEPVNHEPSKFSMCRTAIKLWAKYPSSVDISVLDSPGDVHPTDGGVVKRIAFTAKNDFGAELPRLALCSFGPDGKMRAFNVVRR